MSATARDLATLAPDRAAKCHRIAELMQRFRWMQAGPGGKWVVMDFESGKVEPSQYDGEELAKAGARLHAAWAILEELGASEWHPMATAPKSTSVAVAGGHFVKGVYLLGYCPEEGARPESCVSVIWWEPNHYAVGRGAWVNDSDTEVHPTRWQPLPSVKELGQ